MLLLIYSISLSLILVMNIKFRSINEKDYPIIFKWLETPHVKNWWDPNIKWSLKLVELEYSNYVKGFKIVKLKDKIIKRPFYCYIILINNKPIGYIQYYNKHDFPPEHDYTTNELPKKTAGLDLYIGEKEFIGKGLGPTILKLFCNLYIAKDFEYAFVDPESKNLQAINSYIKAGFNKIKQLRAKFNKVKQVKGVFTKIEDLKFKEITWMIKNLK